MCERELVRPRRSSPKFPQPIFLPTLKLGPTMSTPDVVDVEGVAPGWLPVLPTPAAIVKLSTFEDVVPDDFDQCI